MKVWVGDFRNIDFNNEANLGKPKNRNDRLRKLLDDFNDPRLNLSPSRIGGLDIIGNAYEYLIGDFASDDDESLLDAVIGLPANLFYGTGIPAAILIFDRARTANKRKDVLFIDASHDFAQEKRQNRLRDEDMDKVLKTYEAYKSVKKYALRAKFKEIEENELNLNIPRYVDTFDAEEEIDIDAVQLEIDKIESELAKTRKQMAIYLKELGYGS